jgi:hypothetical protein
VGGAPLKSKGDEGDSEGAGREPAWKVAEVIETDSRTPRGPYLSVKLAHMGGGAF